MLNNKKSTNGDERTTLRTVKKEFYNEDIGYWILDIGGQLCTRRCMIIRNLVMHVKE
jgi:hypothetical protein